MEERLFEEYKKPETQKILVKEIKPNSDKEKPKDTIDNDSKKEEDELLEKIRKSSNPEIFQLFKILLEKDKNRKKEIKELKELKEMEDKKIKDINKKLEVVKSKLSKVEVLVTRSNINLDLISYRDTIKSLLLLFGISLGYINREKELHKDPLGKYSYSGSFSNLVCHLLSKESEKLKKNSGLTRQNIETKENPAKKIAEDNLKFIEACHFIVCSIDNVVHPEYKDKEDEKQFFSQLIVNKSVPNLLNSLKLFFLDPKDIDEFKKIMEKYENKDEEIIIQSYRVAKNAAYKINQKYYEKIKINEYKRDFYLEYIFPLNEELFDDSIMKIKYKDFIDKLERVLKEYEVNSKENASDLISKLIWS